MQMISQNEAFQILDEDVQRSAKHFLNVNLNDYVTSDDQSNGPIEFNRPIQSIQSIQDLLDTLIPLYQNWEGLIRIEHTKSYVTDEVESKLRFFSSALAAAFMAYPYIDGHWPSIVDALCRFRHFGHGYFDQIVQTGAAVANANPKPNADSTVGQSIDLAKLINELGGIRQYWKVYFSMTQYYAQYTGRFSDNEEAVEWLLRFYPTAELTNMQDGDILRTDVTTKEASQDPLVLVRALSKHISLSGDYGDTGYAFKGLGFVRQYIHRLPRVLIKLILDSFSLLSLITLNQTRKQILAIITCENSPYSHHEQMVLKFTYLDSLILADRINMMIYSFFKGHFGGSGGSRGTSIIEPHYSHGNIGEEQILFHFVHDKTLVGAWEQVSTIEQSLGLINDNHNRISHLVSRSFKCKERVYFELGLEHKASTKASTKASGVWKIYLYQHRDGNKFEMADFEMDLSSYHLLHYRDQKILQAIETKLNQPPTKPERFLYSYIYLDGYKGLQQQVFSIEHRIQFDPERQEYFEIPAYDQGTLPTTRFYGKSIHSLTCIVGKNGTGKTNVIGFLKEEFFDILSDLESQEVTKEDLDFQYFVVYTLDDIPYIATNMKVEARPGTEPIPINQPCRARAFGSITKILYIGNSIGIYDSALFQPRKNRNRNYQTNGYMAYGLSMMDLSEGATLRAYSHLSSSSQDSTKERNRYKRFKNLLFQLVLLHDIPKLFERYFNDELHNKDLFISDSGTHLCSIEYALGDLKRVSRGDVAFDETPLFGFLDGEDREAVRIDYLSAGQYAKLALLARLYWFFKGYRDFSNILGIEMEHVFSERDTILLFIDEGELFYHPEWQRNFLSDLMALVQECELPKSMVLQVMVTTNSPFMLSDIRSVDIASLCKPKGGAGYSSPLQTETYAQNIHALLLDRFFMEATIGAQAMGRIKGILKMLQDIEKGNSEVINQLLDGRGGVVDQFCKIFNKDPDDFRAQDFCAYLANHIANIGEPVYKNLLIQRLEAAKAILHPLLEQRSGEHLEEQLAAQIKSLSEQLDKLKAQKKRESGVE